MSELAPLIADLALILVCAGVMTLLFKKLKQPLVLGYIVAGFLAGPHFGLIPSVSDTASIHLWADIGVIFLLFALGLDFSIKKIAKVGGSAIIAALVIIFGMIFLGFCVATAFGWKRMDAIFLGGMIAMSSTTIIYKAFEDMGLLKKQFASLVLSILILEDVLAVVLMVVLSTVSASSGVEGGELVMSLAKLVFFLVLWFVVGLFIIPIILRRGRKLMSDETLLVVSLGLCFGMVVLAARAGFSAAFGAFIMGSILAETVEAEHIEHLVKPVKDLFGAIFFVSVGMMVDPAMIMAHIWPILAITLTVLLGQSFFGTVGVLLSGNTLKTAMQCGFSLTQIGEFAFIIATLGLSLGVTSDFLYPVVVAVSVITIFLTPYMIRLSEPAYNALWRVLPEKWRGWLDRYANGALADTGDSDWKRYVGGLLRTSLIYTILTIAVVILSFRFLVPLTDQIPAPWGRIIAAVGILLLMAPFLRSLMVRHTGSKLFRKLWQANRANRAPLVASVLIRIFLAMGFVSYVLFRLFRFSVGFGLILALLVVLVTIGSRALRRQSRRLEETFNKNLSSRERREEFYGRKAPEFAGKLLSMDMHLVFFDIPEESAWAGQTLAELSFAQRFGIQVAAILRGSRRINIPTGSDRIFPHDRIQVIGTDSQLEAFGAGLASCVHSLPEDASEPEEREMQLRRIEIRAGGELAGKTIRNSGLRDRYHLLVAGVEKEDGRLITPDPSLTLEEGDLVWVVGEPANLSVLRSV